MIFFYLTRMITLTLVRFQIARFYMTPGMLQYRDFFQTSPIQQL